MGRMKELLKNIQPEWCRILSPVASNFLFPDESLPNSFEWLPKTSKIRIGLEKS